MSRDGGTITERISIKPIDAAGDKTKREQNFMRLRALQYFVYGRQALLHLTWLVT